MNGELPTEPTVDDGIATTSSGEDRPGWFNATASISSDWQQATLAMFRPGGMAGRYRLVRILGTGGMGVVYEAWDPELRRSLALKVLRADLAEQDENGASRARLLREAQAMAQLSHPNIIAVYDVGTFADQIFVAMALVPGGSLKSWLSGPPRPWREVTTCFLGAGRGLAAAHERGIVHRDFKPANVLLGAGGTAIVSDFGLAKRPAGESLGRSNELLTLTESGEVLGTPGYMAPEQYLEGTFDARSDQFGFCVSLYRVLFDKHPFACKETDMSRTLENRLNGKEARNPGPTAVPRRIRVALMRGLASDPGDRFPSMAALLGELEAGLEQRRSALLPALLGGLAVLVLLAVFGALAWVTREPPGPPSPVPGISLPATRTLPPPGPALQPAPVSAVVPPGEEQRRVLITSTPRGASVISRRDGKMLGKTPFLYEPSADGEEVELELRLDGYVPSQITMRPRATRTHHETLRQYRRREGTIGNRTFDPFGD